MIKISVIIPIYNMERLLGECLDSILNQTLRELEVICINDGSTDSSLKKIQDYQKKDSRIKIVNQKNTGVAQARNNGMAQAKGEFLYFLDPDDFLPDSEVFSDLYQAAKDNNVKISGGSFEELYEGTEWITTWDGKWEKYAFTKDQRINYMDYQFDFGFTRFIYERKMIVDNNISFPRRKFFEDPVFFVKAMTVAGEFYSLKRFSYVYRTGHKTPSWNKEKIKDLLNGILDNIQIAKEHGYTQLVEQEKIRMVEDYANEIGTEAATELDGELRGLIHQIGECIGDSMLSDEIFCECIRVKNTVVKEVYESKTYRVGKAVVCIPKRIRKVLRGK